MLGTIMGAPRKGLGVAAGLATLLLVAVGCASTEVAPSPRSAAPTEASSVGTTATPTVAPEPIVDINCTPNVNDACAGLLIAGTYHSVLFQPRLTFEVPAGWADHADSRGEYVLFAPGSKPNASEFGARDWIAFEANVTSTPVGCAAEQKFDPSQTAAGIAAWMATRARIVTTSPRPATVGGLNGVTLDVRLAPDAPIECFPLPAVQLVHGLPPSEGYDQAILGGTAMRFYFFDRGPDVLMIEIDDVSGGTRLDEFTAVVNTVQFSQ